MPLLFEELFNCPLCETKFMSKVVGVFDTFGSHYSDLYVACEEDPQPILHQIHLCPKCGFAGFAPAFRELSFDIEVVKKAISSVEQLVQKKSSEFNAGDGYLEIAEYHQANSLEAQVFLKLQASHAYRVLSDDHLELARRFVLEDLQAILEKRLFEKNPEETYLYLAGEMNRLLGNAKKASDYFKLTLGVAARDSFFAKLAEFQLETPNEIIPRKFREYH